MSEFATKLMKLAEKKGTRLVLAADTDKFEEVVSNIRSYGDQILAVKIHHEYSHKWGFTTDEELLNQLRSFGNDLVFILDLKLADIDKTNEMKVAHYYTQGYDAIICHGFQGAKALLPVKKEAELRGRGFFVLVKMTSEDNLFTDEIVVKLSKIAKELKADGVIAPANDIRSLSMIRSLVGNMLIASPGIGAQGGRIEDAMQFSDLPISGRSALKEGVGEFNKKIVAAVANRKPLQEQPTDYKLIEILAKNGVLKFGDLKLKMGRPTTYFFTTGNVDNGEIIQRVSEAYARAIVEKGLAERIDLIFGPAYKGISIATYVTEALFRIYGINIRCAYNRKEPKEHGVLGEKDVVGRIHKGDRVLVIDDVLTDGGTKRESIGFLNSLNLDLKINDVIVLLNREEQDMQGNDPIEKFRSEGVQIHSVLRATKLLSDLRGREINGEVVITEERYTAFLSHQEAYGTSLLSGGKSLVRTEEKEKTPQVKVTNS